MASFLSRLNRRDDGYGGARAQRVRLPLEVLLTVRNRVGTDYVVGIRYLGHDVVAGGNDLDDAVWFGVRFAEGGADYLSVSKGGRFEDARQPKIGEAVYPYTGESGVRVHAHRALGRARPVRPQRAAGRGHPGGPPGGRPSRPRSSRAAASPPSTRRRGSWREERRTCVAAARQTLADPDWFRKIRLGQGHLVRRCEFTNYCEGLDQRHKQVTCKLWDRDFPPDDPGVRLTQRRAPAARRAALAAAAGSRDHDARSARDIAAELTAF